MKYVSEHINEKFTQDSDPIHDLGIGPYGEMNFESSEKLCEFIVDILPAILKTTEIPDDIIFLPKYSESEGVFNWKYYYKINNYIERYLTVNNKHKNIESHIETSSEPESICVCLWKKLLEMGYPKVHQTKNKDDPSYRV